MPITLDKIEEAQNKLNKVQEAASDVNEILVKIKEAILVEENGSVIIDLTTEQKTALLEQYNIRKQTLTDTINDLL